MYKDLISVELSTGNKHIVSTKSVIGSTDANTVTRSTLVILDSDNNADRGVYRCSAENKYGVRVDTFFLRVRYQHSYLYPFGGIVFQLLLLAICIQASKSCRSAERRPRDLGTSSDNNEKNR